MKGIFFKYFLNYFTYYKEKRIRYKKASTKIERERKTNIFWKIDVLMHVIQKSEKIPLLSK